MRTAKTHQTDRLHHSTATEGRQSSYSSTSFLQWPRHSRSISLRQLR
jgi:hypothetical protein